MVVIDFFFFFKQKTAYEMRISDWSSDVCSSDLLRTFSIDLTAGRLQDLAVTEAKVAITGFEESKGAIDIEVVTAGPVASALAVLDSPPLGYASAMGLDTAEGSGLRSPRFQVGFRAFGRCPCGEKASTEQRR